MTSLPWSGSWHLAVSTQELPVLNDLVLLLLGAMLVAIVTRR